MFALEFLSFITLFGPPAFWQRQGQAQGEEETKTYSRSMRALPCILYAQSIFQFIQ